MTEGVLEGLDQHRRVIHRNDRVGDGDSKILEMVGSAQADEVDPEDRPWRAGVGAVDVVFTWREKQQLARFHLPIAAGERAGSFSGDAGDEDMLGSAVQALDIMAARTDKGADVGDAKIARDWLARSPRGDLRRDDHQALPREAFGAFFRWVWLHGG